MGQIALKFKPLTPHEVLNIFEDFRQERILKDFFVNVNFEENVYKVNNVTKMQIPQMYFQNPFYVICRFGFGEKEDLDKRNELYEKYKNINATTSDTTLVKEYVQDLWLFYLQVMAKFLTDEEQQQPQKDKRQGNGSGSGEQSEENDENDTQDADNGDSSNSEQDEEQDSEQSANPDEQGCSENDTQPELEFEEEGEPNDSQEATKALGALSQKIKELANQIIFGSSNDYVSRIKAIISERKKQLVAEGNKVALGYSGKINPRAFARPNNNDWKIFKREGGHQMGGGQKKLWLNFFIDGSGSYYWNVEETQRVVNSFKLASENGTIFDYQCYTLGAHIYWTNKKYDALGCNRDSYVPCQEIRTAINRVPRTKYDVINIILVDGGVWTDNRNHLLDKNDIIFIADASCKIAFDTWFPNAVKIYVKGKYPQELFKEVSSILRKKVN